MLADAFALENSTRNQQKKREVISLKSNGVYFTNKNWITRGPAHNQSEASLTKHINISEVTSIRSLVTLVSGDVIKMLIFVKILSSD